MKVRAVLPVVAVNTGRFTNRDITSVLVVNWEALLKYCFPGREHALSLVWRLYPARDCKIGMRMGAGFREARVYQALACHDFRGVAAV